MIRTLRFAVAALVFILAGCKATEEAKNTAQVRILHASPDTETLLLKLKDGDTKIASVAPGATSAYVTLDAASKDYEIRSAVDGTLIASRTTGFTGGSRYTIVVGARRAALTTAYVEEDTASPSSGNFRFRVENVANAGSVDVYLVAQTAAVATDTPKLYSAGINALSAYTEVAEGDYQLVLTAAGTKDIVFEGAKQRYASGGTYTMGVIPGKSARLANVVQLTYGDSGAGTAVANLRARVRAVHASPDAPQLSFSNGGTLMFSNIPYRGNSSYIASASGDRALTVDAFGAAANPVISRTVTLAGGEDYTLVAANRNAAPELVALNDNNLPPNTGKIRVRFVNMSPDVATADVLVNFAKTVNAVPFKGASSYQELDAGTYTFAFAATSSGAGVATTAATAFDAGKVYTIVLLGTAAAAETKIIADN